MNPSGLSPEKLESIKVVFFQECEELLAGLEAGLLELQRGDRDPETVNAVFRAVHSIKGSAGIFGFDLLVRFSHTFESALEEIRSGRHGLDAETLMALLRASDVLADQVQAARDGVGGPAGSTQAAEEELLALIGAPSVLDDELAELGFKVVPAGPEWPPIELAERRWRIHFRPHASLYAKAGDPLPLLRELRRLGEVAVGLDASALPPLRDLDPEQAYLAWTILLVTTRDEAAIREVFEFVDGHCALEIAPEEQPEIGGWPAPDDAPAAVLTPVEQPGPRLQAVRTESLRVDLDRMDRLADLSGEIVIAHAMLIQRIHQAGLGGDTSVGLVLDEFGALTRELQDSVMAMRAQSLKGVFQRMSRLVRETEAATGKQVDLTVSGEATEVDRTVIERLTDPLTHMVRNAVDHGLETPEVRLAAGKPPRGSLLISAAHRAGRIVIEVSDDGAGIDRDRVKAIATDRGLIPPGSTLTDDEADNLIFLPGFSTARTLSDLSGRGVGLDVVKRGVQEMGGRITIASRPGEGSVFTLSLPLTLAVLDGMVVSAGGQKLVVPVGVLLEAVQPRRSDIHAVGNAGLLFTYRGQQAPLIDLAEVLDCGERRTDVDRCVALMVEDAAGRRAALLVDEITDQRQVVIKSLESNYRRIEGVAAATILGDGRVALILDADSLIEAHGRGAGHAVQRLAATG